MPLFSSSLPANSLSPDAHRPISLGLQGGGVYGAFTWGVLDRLLDDERLPLHAISGTSAGAINAVVVADGMADGGGRAGAQRALTRFWTALSEISRLSPLQRTPFDYLLGRWTLETSPGYHMMQVVSVLSEPAHMMPWRINPMRDFLASAIDFDRVRTNTALRLFIHATNVRTGKGEGFLQEELDAQRLMAAICLPQVFPAVEIDGEAYWDGSYVANPALAPLVAGGYADDVIIVQINPVARQELPRSIADINSRSNEIVFNMSMMREVAAIEQLQHVIDEVDGKQLKRSNVRMHLITGTETLSAYSLSSKYNTEWSFVSHLHDLGFAAADRWLANNFSSIGVQGTLKQDAIYHAEHMGARNPP